MMFALGFLVGFVLTLVWHWYTLAHWSARIREACGGKIPGYDDDDDERNER
jgi:hypothetical protein